MIDGRIEARLTSRLDRVPRLRTPYTLRLTVVRSNGRRESPTFVDLKEPTRTATYEKANRYLAVFKMRNRMVGAPVDRILDERRNPEREWK